MTTRHTTTPDVAPESTPPPRRRVVRRRALIALIGVVVLVLVVAAGGYGYALYRFDQVKKLTIPSLASGGSAQPMTILLVGNNSRAALNGKQSNSFGTAQQVGGARSDVTMLLHLNPATHQASLLSIPRDLFMPIPGTTKANRVDAALNFGPDRLVQTIQQDLGITINHYVELNFDTFQNVINILGGVKMYFPTPVRDAYSGLNITQAGCQQLNGFQALAVVRARHMFYQQNGTWQYDGLGDLSRIQRDHEFLRVLAAQVQSQAGGNPLVLNKIIGAVAPQLQVDSAFSLSTLLGLVTTYHSINPNAIPTATLPVAYANNYVYRGANYGDVVMPVQPLDQQVIDTFLGRTPPPTTPASRAGVKVEVLNGSGIPGRGHQVAAQLQSGGFTVSNIGTTTVTGSPAETIVYYRPGHLAEAQQLAAALGGEAILGRRPLSTTADVQLVVGSNLTIAPPATASSSASPTPSSSPTTAPAPVATSPVAPVVPPHRTLPWYDPRACP